MQGRRRLNAVIRNCIGIYVTMCELAEKFETLSLFDSLMLVRPIADSFLFEC